MPRPDASIVIVAYGKREVTERCLQTLDHALGPALSERFELVLVDNASPDDTLELFDLWRERATVVALERNLHFSGGCNAGAAAATGETLIFLNNDTEVGPGALEELVQTLAAPDVAAAGLRLLYPDGTIQHAGVAMLAVNGLPVPHHVFHHQAGDLPAARCTLDLDVVTAACIAVRREAFDAVGGFDTAYENGWEDVDLCLKLRMAGHRIVYRGDLVLVHDEGRTRGITKDESRNAGVFYARWRHLLDPDDALAAAVFDARLARARLAGHGAPGGPVVVEGHLRGISGEGAEARALVGILEEAGLDPAATTGFPAFVEPDLGVDEARPVDRALARVPATDAVALRVPVGRTAAPVAGGVLRLACMPRGPVGTPDLVWAASASLRDELIAAGLDAERVTHVPPMVPLAAPGAGGEGALALLPGHDLPAASAVLDALSAHAGAVRVRALPSAAVPALARLVAERHPHVELLPPCSSEVRFAALAANCDVVVGADPEGDPFERRPLIAAAAGCEVLTRPAGPAADVLAATGDGALPSDLRAAIAVALERSADGRVTRAAAVEAACGRSAGVRRCAALLSAPAALRA